MESLVDPKFWRDRPVLVTGATGLVGGWCVDRLLQAGAEVTCLVRDWTPGSHFHRSQNIEKCNLVRGDLCDESLVERALGEYEIDTVIHLAAQTIVTIANSNPLSTFESNVRGTYLLLEACRRSPKVKQIVVASSDKAYGDQDQLPYTEETPLEGRHPYDVSKSCADLITTSYHKSFGLPVAITRCGNFYGGGDLNWNRIIPGTIRSILKEEAPYIRSDGKFIRDYFYVEDGAEAYLHLAQKLAQNPEQIAGQSYNFSNEIQVDVLSLVHKILDLMNSKLKPIVAGEADNEIRHQYLDATKAREQLGWSPRFTLEQGLEKTIGWYREILA